MWRFKRDNNEENSTETARSDPFCLSRLEIDGVSTI